ncbi:MAG: ATP-binding protein [Chloroflexota bacterium]
MVIATGAPQSTPSEMADSASRSYFSISQAAELLGVSRVTVWRWVRAGHLPVVRLGHRTSRIKREDLERLPIHIGPSGSRSRVVHETRSEEGSESDLALAPDAEHFVQFYESDEFLLQAVAEFIGPALRMGDAGIVVATQAHRTRLDDVLLAQGFDLDAARAAGQYISLDAAELLSQFMVDAEPDSSRFEAVLGGLVAEGAAAGRRVRIYGEMVALLAMDGNHPATIRLEQLWNELRRKRSFSLFCGYPMDRFGGEALGELLGEVCEAHAHVVPAESYTSLAGPNDRLRAVTVLQQQAASLRAEIAERRRAEEQLRVALEAERVARAAAEAALRSRDEFLATASHELRTPITVLSGQAQLALRRLTRDGQLEPARAARTFEAITGQADKLARLVGQLLDLSRLQAGKLMLERERADLGLLVEQAVSAAREWSNHHQINFDGPTSLEAVVDPLRLEQVLTNLLDNAVKYSPDGGQIDVCLSRCADGAVEVAVRDHGLGIPAEKRTQIFERFYQAHGNGFRSGMGLGLHISREIVELHGGAIRAEFPDDVGTRFVVRLPAHVL